jgi:hypothetical protein
MDQQAVPPQLPVALLTLRVSIALLMFPWAIDKIVRPEHAASVFENFYFLPGVSSTVLLALAIVQLAILAGFVAGVAPTWTYGLVLAMHAISTLSTWRQYATPFEGANILFFAAWPALGACIALFLLRSHDRLLSFSHMRDRMSAPARG